MSMYHKAFVFDWAAFEREFLGLLVSALEEKETARLTAFIEANIETLSDPYEGEPLIEGWQSLLENKDVHELADFALTRYYDPAEDCGLGYDWTSLDDLLSPSARAALLGNSLGPEGNRFDPGRMGSYFQTPEEVVQSLAILRPLTAKSSQRFRALLNSCSQQGLGLYVTF
jgi:hypothetical protein